VSEEIPYDNSFYFRLTSGNLFFTEDKQDFVVKGSLAVKNIHGTKNNNRQEQYCFDVMNSEDDEWVVCAENSEEQQAWICGISETIG